MSNEVDLMTLTQKKMLRYDTLEVENSFKGLVTQFFFGWDTLCIKCTLRQNMAYELHICTIPMLK
jgi:hypothetical protein